ncbi:DUF4327 family protein [Myxacorys almedinensis]|uniref:DUF4327 family protein n=1 Tax=Myxacorys almedinensis A TaxID=2690445 RepID=A0A8J7Z5E9_9CYAN|nr:DUF4327 family protein [Myxacorys almedinensis]NDJ16753.1 DUF4327 family protein [Myxacorys almedinensis A]
MLQTAQYSLSLIQDEVRQLVDQGAVSRYQPIYTLCKHIPVREWVHFEGELECYGFLLRDRIGDLVGHESWEND